MHHSRYLVPAALALGLGIPLSPDTMVILGNFMGKTGLSGLVLLAVTTALFIGIALNMAPGLTIGTGAQAFLPLAVKGSAAVFLSTGILVSSGFVFNEVFVYWFPNFGFAFLLLAVIFVIQSSGTDTALKFQILFVGLTLGCFFSLILSGLIQSGTESPQAPGSDQGSMALALMLWIGFDLAWSSPGQNRSKTTPVAVITGAGLVFILWGLVSISHVPLEKLDASSLPHMKTADALLGQTGRYIMGTAVIFGTLSAVNALFLACGHTAEQLASQNLLPLWTRKTVFIPLVLSLTIGLMMGLGMAGSDDLELWIRAAFLLWLMTYVRPGRSPVKLFLTAIPATGMAWILFSGDRPGLTMLYMIIILGPGLVPGLILSLTSKPSKKNQRSLP